MLDSHTTSQTLNRQPVRRGSLEEDDALLLLSFQNDVETRPEFDQKDSKTRREEAVAKATETMLPLSNSSKTLVRQTSVPLVYCVPSPLLRQDSNKQEQPPRKPMRTSKTTDSPTAGGRRNVVDTPLIAHLTSTSEHSTQATRLPSLKPQEDKAHNAKSRLGSTSEHSTSATKLPILQLKKHIPRRIRRLANASNSIFNALNDNAVRYGFGAIPRDKKQVVYVDPRAARCQQQRGKNNRRRRNHSCPDIPTNHQSSAITKKTDPQQTSNAQPPRRPTRTPSNDLPDNLTTTTDASSPRCTSPQSPRTSQRIRDRTSRTAPTSKAFSISDSVDDDDESSSSSTTEEECKK